MSKPKPTRLDYCQFLLTTPVNYTITHFADHCERFSHDQINRYLADERLPPRYVWESVKPHIYTPYNSEPFSEYRITANFTKMLTRLEYSDETKNQSWKSFKSRGILKKHAHLSSPDSYP